MSQPRSGCNTWLEDMINSISPGEDHNMGSADDEDFTGLPCDVSYDLGLGGKENFHYFGAGGEDIPDGNKVHAAWLLHSGLSMGKIDSFLSLEMIKDLPLSFRSTRELCSQAEMLPSGPCWKSQVIHTSHPTKSPVILYWRDPIECIASIFNHPLFHRHMDLMPRKIYSTAEKLCHVYTGWMSGNVTWDMQSAIPKGATLLGTILSSDKTNITALTGDHVTHPLLISLSNIHMNVHLKSSTNSFVLTALLPVPKFIHKKNRYCFTALMSYITDTPEAMMLAVIGGKTSPVMMAMYKQFRDAFHHEPQTKSMMIAQLAVVCSRADPNDLEAYFHKAHKF
ncbi:uncharacterized protein F5891DRAFT_1192500 [Suillus fuscotomentosus]|uniref:Uncharacterized protein n=1 Tax=Suillus fuscotomentosus TaxID=1912939 RepID=A0AAD4HHN2_9AGAM|nr:uncharacterized protein F5891DRAFT_1192500 [Suillus fuscotomentosus]KAG1896847.1 hypothetical protein F5891DRAFT_1192500 [Suillus fuscotomentosus]